MGHSKSLSGIDFSSEARDSHLGETPKRSIPFERNIGRFKLIPGGMGETYTDSQVVPSKTKPMLKFERGLLWRRPGWRKLDKPGCP